MNAMWHPNDVIRPVLLRHIRFKCDMMLAKDNTPRHAARSTLVMLVTNKRRTLQWPVHSMDLNPSKHMWDILKRNVRAQPLQPNLRELIHVLLIRCAILQQFLHRYIHYIMETMYIAVIATTCGHTMYRIEIKYDILILQFLFWGCPC